MAEYRNRYVPVKYFLNSYRAYSDGRNGIDHLEKYLATENILVSDWKVIWIGTCTLLRSSIDLFKVDSNSCINEDIRNSLKFEWSQIKRDKDVHPIFWEFLQKERNNIIHEYQWAAYEQWLSDDGNYHPPKISLLSSKPEDMQSVLIMRKGHYKGRNSLDLLKESADWVEERISNSIKRAGFNPNEVRRLGDFSKPSSTSSGILGPLSE
ncbi:MAG: hypothetical protein ABJC55_16230 [Algoriphagus sp.]